MWVTHQNACQLRLVNAVLIGQNRKKKNCLRNLIYQIHWRMDNRPRKIEMWMEIVSLRLLGSDYDLWSWQFNIRAIYGYETLMLFFFISNQQILNCPSLLNLGYIYLCFIFQNFKKSFCDTILKIIFRK